MSRFLSSSMQARAELSVVAFRQLVDFGITSSTLYFCTGMNFLFTLGNTYTPILLGGIEPIQEESDAFPRGARMWVSAMNSSQLYEPLRESLFGRPVVIRRAFLDVPTGAVVNSPEVMFKGKINTVELRFADPERGNFYEVEAETELRREPRTAYFTKESLWESFSGDTFYDHQPWIPLQRAMWGQQATFFDSGTDNGVGRPRGPRRPGNPYDIP